MTVVRLLAISFVCVLAAAPSAHAQVTPGAGGFVETPHMKVSVSRNAVSTRLGDDFGFSTEIRNRGPVPRSGLVASLNVVGLSSGIYVDPEDWSSERTKSVPTLEPGESTTISWSVTAVTGGRAAVYVVVLPEEPGQGEPVSSPAIDVRIAETKDLNSGGVLPLALGVPALLGLLTVAVRRRRNR
jgi:hypothetical protein